MRKISYLFLVLGLLSIGIGIFMMQEKTEEPVVDKNKEQIIFTEVTDQEKEEISKYLNARYNQEFNVIEHVSRFCIIQKEESYDIDIYCDKDDIIDDIYKIQDNEKITFYVKKVSVKEKVKIYNNNSKTQSQGFYDNYILYNVLEKINNELLESFKEIEKVKSVSVINGIGVEKPIYKKENNKYISYVIYDNINSDLQSIVNKDIDSNSYISLIGKNQVASNVELSVTIDDELTKDNIKDYIKTIHDNYYVNLIYGLRADNIIFIFNNKLVIDYKKGNSFEIMKYEDNPLEELIKIYDKTIVNDFSNSSEDTIYYDKFINLDKIEFAN